MRDAALSVLLIEDNPADDRFVRELLAAPHRRSLRVTSATSLKKGLALLEQEQFDVVLLDLHLPDSAGVETVRRVRRAVRDKPVIVLSGQATAGGPDEVTSAGADDFLEKMTVETVLARSIDSAHERWQLREDLRTALNRLERATSEVAHRGEEVAKLNDELELHAYLLFHELKRPLRAVLTYTELLRMDTRGSLADDASQHVTHIVEAARAINDLIDASLKLSNVATSPLTPELVDLEPVVRSVASSLKLDSETLVVAGGPWPAVRTDTAVLRTVLQNLVENGLKFNTSPHRRVEVSSRQSGDGRVELLVRDNGIGIDGKQLDAIFKPFRRLHVDQEYTGSGLGLAIVRRAVVRLGGDVWAESEPGKGSTFHLLLPAAGPPPEKDQPQ